MKLDHQSSEQQTGGKMGRDPDKEESLCAHLTLTRLKKYLLENKFPKVNCQEQIRQRKNEMQKG